MPIVFALQRPDLASSILVGEITWILSKLEFRAVERARSSCLDLTAATRKHTFSKGRSAIPAELKTAGPFVGISTQEIARQTGNQAFLLLPTRAQSPTKNTGWLAYLIPVDLHQAQIGRLSPLHRIVLDATGSRFRLTIS
jgi:hypothetical protein